MRFDDGNKKHWGKLGPPHGCTTGEVCEELGWTVARLLDLAEKGMVKSPTIHNGDLVWPLSFALDVKVNGLRIQGTFEGMPPGYHRSHELRRWRGNVCKGKRKYLKCDRRTRRPLKRPEGGGK